MDNNYLYFRNLLLLNPNNSDFSKRSSTLNKFVDHLFLLFSYKQLTTFLRSNFSLDLKSKHGLIQKLRKFSLISLFLDKNKICNINEKKNLFSVNNLLLENFDFSKLFFSYSLKKDKAYPFIIREFFLILWILILLMLIISVSM